MDAIVVQKLLIQLIDISIRPKHFFWGGGVNPPTCGFFLGTRDVPEDRYIHSERFFPFNYNHSPYVRLIDYPNSTSVQFTQFRLVSTLVNFHFYNLRYTSPLEVFGPNPRIAISVMRGGVEVFNAEAVGPKVTSFSVTYNLELDENDIISMHNPRPNSTLTMRGTGHGFFISFV